MVVSFLAVLLNQPEKLPSKSTYPFKTLAPSWPPASSVPLKPGQMQLTLSGRKECAIYVGPEQFKEGDQVFLGSQVSSPVPEALGIYQNTNEFPLHHPQRRCIALNNSTPVQCWDQLCGIQFFVLMLLAH